MNEKNPYDFGYNAYSGNYLSSDKQDARTSQNLEAIERLFDELDVEDKNTSESFSLDNQGFDNYELNYESKVDSNPISYQDTSSYDKPSYDMKVDNDPLNQTREIDSVDLAELKALQAELHRIYDEPEQNVQDNSEQSQSKGKSLTKATKQGIAFSNGSLTRTFLDCVVLCFVTASMGFAFLMNIISQI